MMRKTHLGKLVADARIDKPTEEKKELTVEEAAQYFVNVAAKIYLYKLIIKRDEEKLFELKNREEPIYNSMEYYNYKTSCDRLKERIKEHEDEIKELAPFLVEKRNDLVRALGMTTHFSMTVKSGDSAYRLFRATNTTNPNDIEIVPVVTHETYGRSSNNPPRL